MPQATAPGAAIALASVPNTRDVGGWTTADGRTVRRGLVYRATALDRLSEADAAELVRRGIRTVADLRTRAETEASPDRPVGDALELELDVLADAKMSVPANIPALVQDTKTIVPLLEDGTAVRLMGQAYRDVVRLPSARAAYRTLFLRLLEPEGVPALIHCTTGKDRTGWATAALLTLLGVPRAEVERDYLLTNEQLLPSLAPLFDRFAAAGGDPELLRPILGVDVAYLRGAFDEMESMFGSIESYFADGLGIDRVQQEALRDRFLEAADA